MTLASRMAGDVSRPVDLAHLARQTMGNADLEREVLRLFLKQSERVLQRLAMPEEDPTALAHALVGSARGIGAWRVADLASAMEERTRAKAPLPAGDLARLKDAVNEANAFIRSLD